MPDTYPMMYFFLAAFLLSVVGMTTMILVKRWELKNEKLIFAGVRPKVAQAVRTGTYVAGTVAPAVARYWWRHLWGEVREFAKRTTAWGILRTEVALEKVLQTIRHSTAPKAEGEVSEFLREVAEHKKQLQEQASEDHYIVE